MKLDRLSDITSELSSSLLKAIVVPGGWRGWLARSLGLRVKAGARGRQSAGSVEQQGRPAAVANVRGPVVLLGGCPVPDEAVVEMIRLTGGRTSRVAIIAVMAQEPDPTSAEALRSMQRFGVKNTEVFPLTTRGVAEHADWPARLEGFQTVILTCSEPSFGVQVLCGTACAAAIVACSGQGRLVVGLKAGAALLAEHLVTGGELTEAAPVNLAVGLGVVRGVMVDTDFSSQARFGRLVKAMNTAGMKGLLGAGLDSGSAVLIRGGEARVLGDSSVTFLDPRETAVGASSVAPGAVYGLRVHVLMDGFGLDLRSRKPFGPPKELPPAAGGR